MINEPTTLEPRTAPQLRTRHVRVRMTARDLEHFRASFASTAYRRERCNPLAMAINRVLRPGFAATFDGISIGLLRTKEPLSEGFREHKLAYHECPPFLGGAKAYYLRQDSGDGLTPFFRGVPAVASKHHQRAVARRAIKPLRVTVSLPELALRRTDMRGVFDGQ